MMKWSDRTPREQALMLIAAGLLGLFVLWQFVFMPVRHYRTLANAQHAASVRDLDIVGQGLPQIASNISAINTPPLTRAGLVEAARSHAIALSRVQPDGDAHLTLWVDSVGSAVLYQFLSNLILTNGAIIERASISAADNEKVSAQITIRLGV